MRRPKPTLLRVCVVAQGTGGDGCLATQRQSGRAELPLQPLCCSGSRWSEEGQSRQRASSVEASKRQRWQGEKHSSSSGNGTGVCSVSARTVVSRLTFQTVCLPDAVHGGCKVTYPASAARQ